MNRQYSRSSWLILAIAAVLLTAIVGLSSGPTRRLLLNSAVLAGGATAIALPLGTILAVLGARFDLPGRRVAIAALGLLLFLPLYVQLAGWDAALGKLGWFSLAFGSVDRPWLDGMRGAIFVHALAAVPWAALIVALGLAQVDSRQEEAALLEASPLTVLLRMTLPQCGPFIAAAGLWVVVTTTAEMTVTNIYLIAPGSATYTEELYMSLAATGAVTQATLSVLPGIAAITVLLGAALMLSAQLASRRVLAKANVSTQFAAGKMRWPLAALMWIAISLLPALPLASLVTKAGFLVEQVGSGRVRSWSAIKAIEVVGQAPWEFRQEFAWTLVTAVCAATLALALAILLAWPARRGGLWAAPAMLFTVLGLVVPGPLVGVAIIELLNQEWSPVLIWLYDRTALAPVLAQTVRALPLAIFLAWHSFAMLSDDVLSAAELDDLGRWQTLWQIALPQRRLALAGAWLAALAIAAGDLAWSQLVIPPGMDTIQRRVFGLVHSGVEEQVAGICLVVVLVYGVLAGLILQFSRQNRARESRRGRV